MQVIVMKDKESETKRIMSVHIAVKEAMPMVKYTKDLFIVKEARGEKEDGYYYYICRPIRDREDWRLEEHIVEFPESVEVIVPKDFLRYVN